MILGYDRTPVIVQAAFDKERPCRLCQGSLEMFISILGAEAENMALEVIASGGVYLGGGIPPQILWAIEDGPFLESFGCKGRMSGHREDMPLHVILNPKAALMGAACHAMAKHHFTENSEWGLKRKLKMGWKISPQVSDILDKAQEFVGISREDAGLLLRLDLESKETYAVMETANRLSRKQFRGKAESHLHIGVNVAPCPFNCSFCSLTEKAGIFKEDVDFSEETILRWAKMGEVQSADALNLMTTGTFSFERLLEIGRLLKREVSVPLVANTRDINHREGEKLLEAGFVGAYHAVRLGEGVDTPFKREKRIQTIQVLNDVGLLWMNCIEPVGPEHSLDDIVDLMFLAKKHRAVYSGVMRRINFPRSPMERFGMITEREMARMVAVSRLVMGDVPRAHCTHEPHSASLMAGANLFFPEVGASPRDGMADTGKGRGKSLGVCRAIFKEMEWDPDLPSNCFPGAASS
ncbi:Radical SAM domain protein (modular protein) [uncultured Desulfatiglans sp.]|nr:Radical SAM domain protein (modular protein) [uncultured Desulfatiglans sp.]